jgi:hypothetical protein
MDAVIVAGRREQVGALFAAARVAECNGIGITACVKSSWATVIAQL